jgi:hypothetical protein
MQAWEALDYVAGLKQGYVVLLWSLVVFRLTSETTTAQLLLCHYEIILSRYLLLTSGAALFPSGLLETRFIFSFDLDDQRRPSLGSMGLLHSKMLYHRHAHQSNTSRPFPTLHKRPCATQATR